MISSVNTYSSISVLTVFAEKSLADTAGLTGRSMSLRYISLSFILVVD